MTTPPSNKEQHFIKAYFGEILVNVIHGFWNQVIKHLWLECENMVFSAKTQPNYQLGKSTKSSLNTGKNISQQFLVFKILSSTNILSVKELYYMYTCP